MSLPYFCNKCQDAGYTSLRAHLQEFIETENKKLRALKFSTDKMVGKASVLDALEEFLKDH